MKTVTNLFLKLTIFIGLLMCSPNILAIRGRLSSPGPLFSFGDNILSAKEVKSDNYMYYLEGDNLKVLEVTHSWLIGISDSFSVEFGIPIFFDQVAGPISSPGMGSIFNQFEYAYVNYSEEETGFSHQMTILLRLGYPTATTDLISSDALLTPNFIIGATNNINFPKWAFYQAFGLVFNTEDNNAKILGNDVLYTLGGGYTIGRMGGSHVHFMIELTGVHSGHTTIDDQNVDIATNLILIGPSLRFGFPNSKVFQCGFQYPICQTRLNQEDKLNFVAAAGFTFTFKF